MARYESWREFRVALEQSVGKRMSTKCYKTVEDWLHVEALHPPFGDGDIEDAISILKLKINYVPLIKDWLYGEKE